MKILPVIRGASLTATLCMLAGCSSMQRINDAINSTDADHATASAQLQKMTTGSPVQEISGQWINTVPLNAVSDKKEALPGCAVTLTRPGEMTLADVGAFITQDCKIPVVITPDAQFSGTQQGATERMSGAIPVPAPDASGMVPLAQMGGASRPATVSIANTLKGIHWQGSLSGLLDHVTTRLGLSWRFEQGRIVIFYFDTRSFPVSFLDLQTSSQSRSVYGMSTSSSGNGASGEGNTSQTTNTDMNVSRYKELEETIKAMLTPESGRMSIGSGMLTVTDTPRVLNAIGSYIEGRNTEMTRQVVLNVKIWSVTKKRQDQLGLDWDAIFRSGSVGLSLGNAMAGTASSAMTGGVSILDGKFANSNAFVHALAQQGSVSVVTQNANATTNMSPVRIQVVTQQDYISRVSTENTANVGSSTSVDTSTISTGFNMTLLPYLMPASDRMELQFSISLSDEPDMQAENIGEVALKLPKTKLHNVAQNVILRSGQSLLLSGHQQTGNSGSKQGVGTPGFFGLGGGATMENSDTILVMLITPTLLG